MPKRVYTVYKVTHIASGQFYVGVHQTTDPQDDYLGSGLRIQRAVAKYGKEAFCKEVLFVYDTPEEMFQMERQIVTEAFVARTDTYNLCPGGQGGWGFLNNDSEVQRAKAYKSNARQRQMAALDPTFREPQRRTGSKNFKRLHAEGKLRHDTFRGRTHTEETKAKMRAAKVGHGKGEDNSQYGTKWVCRKGDGAKKIPKDRLGVYLRDGWTLGRKLK